MNQANDTGHGGQETPWIVIPYWAGDLGRKTVERPLPPTPTPGVGVAPGVLSYACESIAVVGGTPGVFTPGLPTTVAVTVRNYGKGAGLDLLSLDLWWSAPTTEFGQLTKKAPMVQAVAMLARDGLAQRPPLVQHMTFTTPADAGEHICVVVRVTAGSPIVPGDPSPDGAPVWPSDPTGDRHWAQRNLHTVLADSGGKFHISFSSANATDNDLPFLIRANPVVGRSLEILARELRATPRKAEGSSITLRPLMDFRTQRGNLERAADAHTQVAVTIRANHRLPMVFEGQLQQPLGSGEFTAFEVVQVNAGKRREPRDGSDMASDSGTKHSDRLGSIGVVVFGARRG